MYQHGQRLADIVDFRSEDFLETMALQGKSYLAAINALTLVDQGNAWIQYVLPSGEKNKVRFLLRQPSHLSSSKAYIPTFLFSRDGITIINPFPNSTSVLRALILTLLLWLKSSKNML